MPSENTQKTSSCLYVIATPIGHLSDLSARACQTLEDVDLVVCENKTKAWGLMRHLGIKKTLISMNAGNEHRQLNLIQQHLSESKQLALITDAGTPAISDPGYQLVRLCHQKSIRVVPIPGPCAAITAISASGIPSAEFVFVGFLPKAIHARQQCLSHWHDSVKTIVFYESARRLMQTLSDCLDIFGPLAEVCVARELTKIHESIQTSTLGEYLNRDVGGIIKGECVVMIAGVHKDQSQLSSQERHMFDVLRKENSLSHAAHLCALISKRPRSLFYRYGQSNE